MKKLNLNAIRIDGGTQSRVQIDMDAVADYAEAAKAGIEFPPVIVFHDGADHWLADGFHRFHAHKQAGKASIPADIRDGTVRDAILFSLGANCTHGLRRTNADKRKAVAAMLTDEEWTQWSDRKIADACGVSNTFVSNLRKPPEVSTVDTLGPEENEAKAANSAPKAPAKVVTVATPAPGGKAELPNSSPAPAANDEPEDFGPSPEEIAAAQQAEEDEIAALRKVVDTDDKLGAAMAEIKRLTALNRVLEERVNGLMNEKNAALSAAKSWQRKAEKAEREARRAA